MKVSTVSANKTRSFVSKSYDQKMKLKFPEVGCSFKTNQALLHTQSNG